jgi:S1-C subfamily serine protease
VAAVLIQRGEIRRPTIGILARSEELDAGRRAVRVLRVEAGTPAERCGLAAGDLLLAAAGEPLLTLDDLQRALVLGGGAEIPLEAARGAARRSLTIRPRLREAA